MNKLLIKLSGIMAIAFSSINLFAFIGIHFTIPYTVLSDNLFSYFILLTIAIISFACLIGGIIFLHYKDLSDNEFKRKEKYVLVWSLFFLFFCPLSGIFGLIIYFVSFKHILESKNNYIDELKELNNLLEEGYITEKEYDAKKKRILNI